MYSVGPKPRKEQQVYIKNPQDYIIPQSAVNSALYNAQQAETVEKAGANKTFAKYYCGTGDNRSFVWIDERERTKSKTEFEEKALKGVRKYGTIGVADQFRDMYGKKTFFGIMRDEVKLRKYNVQKYGPLSLQALKEAASRNTERLRRIANSVFEEQHQEMMLVKDAENAQGSDPAPFFPICSWNQC